MFTQSPINSCPKHDRQIEPNDERSPGEAAVYAEWLAERQKRTTPCQPSVRASTRVICGELERRIIAAGSVPPQ